MTIRDIRTFILMPEQLPDIQTIEVSCAILYQVAPDIIHVKWKHDDMLEVENIEEVSEAYQTLSEGKRLKVISHFTPNTTISPEARKHAAKRSPDVIALAYVIHSLPQRIVLRFYIRMRGRKNPTKVFHSYEEALEWIRTVEG